MNLRKKTILIVTVTFVLLTLVLSISLQSVLTDYFRNEEKQINTVNLQRVLASFNNNFTILNYLANDWSHRDETYQFVQDGNIEFIRRNLVVEIFRELDVNFIIIQDLAGNTVYAGSYDRETDAFGSISPELYKFLKPGESILNFDSSLENNQGLVMLKGSPLLLVASPILKSDLDSPSAGVFILGKYFGDSEINIMSHQVQFPIQVDFYSSNEVTEDFKLARYYFETNEGDFYSQVLSSSNLGGYLLLRDVDQKPAFIIRIEQFRNIAKNADIIIRYVFLAMITSILAFGVLFFFVIEETVLSRLLRLNTEVQRITSNPQKSQNVTVDRKDEISSLSSNINLMLESLGTAEKQRIQAEQQLQLVVESVDDTIFTISKDLNEIHAFGGQPELLGFDISPTTNGYFFSQAQTKNWKTSHIQPMMRALGGEHLIYDWETNQNGSEYYFQISMSPLVDPRGEITGIVGIARNITKLKKMDIELLQKFEELSALYSVAQLYLTQLSLGDLQTEICKITVRFFHAKFAWIGKVSLVEHQIEPIASTNISISQIEPTILTKDLWTELFLSKQPRFLTLESPVNEPAISSPYLVTIPLIWKSKTNLILCYQTDQDPNTLFPGIQFLESFRNLADLVLANTILFEEVNENRSQLQDLSRKLVQVHEEERRALARELHDEIGQYLTALKLQIGLGKKSNGENQVFITRSQKLVDELIQKVRQMSLDLRPSILDDLGLLPAFEWFFDRYETQTGIKVFFQQNGLNRNRFAPDIEITTFRVIQEALTNVARHAQTATVKVNIQVTDTEICVEVEDEGVGFDLKSGWKSKSSGIMGMMERVKLVNGNFEIHSGFSEGTKISLRIPIEVEEMK
ncbi:MAG: hypothetical protein CVU46_16325 [Chloroflexi bacterium HGW-Chloroflexi-8]|nr:MAG: hypothetical protein CVU46_16325 [Chloroflexi bacterium HGW-Chloroflexi-8]